jgi:hypothetical protein
MSTAAAASIKSPRERFSELEASFTPPMRRANAPIIATAIAPPAKPLNAPPPFTKV